MKPLSAQPTRPARRAATAWLIGLLVLAPAFAAESIDWPQASYNPVPLPDDLLVPMPCNGAMAFRVIAVGPSRREVPEGTDFGGLSGPLPLGPNDQGAYLLGKYEVSRLQAAALRAFAQDSDCPSALDPTQVGPDQTSRALAAEQRRPEAYIAWYEARGLAYDYAAWLRLRGGDYPTCNDPNRQSGPCLPRLAGEPAVVRLPTEPEWEYAARGGQAVSVTAFRNPLPPLTAGLDRHAWTVVNAGADPRPIGTRLAGPLGLHDIFGNVSEIQYATEASERGEVFIARGGGYQSQPDQADSRYRDRFRVYDEQGRGRLSETGLRLLIGAPVRGPRASPAPEPWGAPEPDRSTVPDIATGLPLWRTSWLALLLAGLVLIQVLGLLRLLWRRRTALPEPSTPRASAPTSPRVPNAPFAVFRDRLKDGSEGPAMVALPGGRFQMGSPENEPDCFDDERQHAVRVGPFAIGRTEVTFDEYDAFAKATGRALPDDQGWGRGRQPVINLSWDDATAYVEWLSEQTGKPYRLPTEAEWEYAARAGTDTRWSFGDDEADLAKHAWYGKNAGGKAHAVATRKPNPWGLYDMHGNLWELVSDWYGPYPDWGEVQTDPTGPTSGASRVLRGGAFSSRARFLRSAGRLGNWPEGRGRNIGFRCARAPRRQP